MLRIAEDWLNLSLPSHLILPFFYHW